MSERILVLGGKSGNSDYNGVTKYTSVDNGAVVSSNGAYMMGPRCSSMGVDTISAEAGDWISIVPDYTNTNLKRVEMGAPTILKDTLHDDGIILTKFAIVLWFDGSTWTDDFHTVFPLRDTGTFEFNVSSDITLSDLDGIDYNTDLYIEVYVCGGGGVGTNGSNVTSRPAGDQTRIYTNFWHGGGGGGSTLKVGFVALKSQLEPIPIISAVLGAAATPNGFSTLAIDGVVISDNIPNGEPGYRDTSNPVVMGDISRFILVDSVVGEHGCYSNGTTSVGNDSFDWDGSPHRPISDVPKDSSFSFNEATQTQYYTYTYYLPGGQSGMSDQNVGGGNGGRGSGGKGGPSGGQLVIKVRPATSEEVTAQIDKLNEGS